MTTTTTSKATIAGILDIASGVMALMGGAVLAAIGLVGTGVLYAIPDDMPPIQWMPLAFFGPMALMVLIAGVIAIIGGIKAIKRSSWAWTLAGAIAALVCCIPLGIASLVVTVMAEGEFRGRG
ncbi:MAG: hypothetical protein ABFS37_05140 [Acidobacteriota bacterium]